jgi:hypothetical protein
MYRTLVLCGILLSPAVASAELKPAPELSVVCAADAAGNRSVAPALLTGNKCAGDCVTVAQKMCSGPVAALAVGGGAVVAAGTSWQGAVVTGLGNFIADRAQQEVATWFDDLVREKLCELKTATKELWFPHTCKLVQDDMGTGQQLASGLLIQAIKDDIPSLLVGVTSYIDAKLGNTAIAAFIGSLPALVAVGQQLITGVSPFELLKNEANDPMLRSRCRARADKSVVTGACLIMFAGITVDYYGSAIVKPTTIDELQQLAVKLLASGEYRKAVCAAFDDRPECTDLPPKLAPLLDATVITEPATLQQLFKVINDAIAVNDYLRNLPPGPTSGDAIREQVAHTLDLLDPMWTDLGTLIWGATSPSSFTAFHDALAAGAAFARSDYQQFVADIVELAKDSGVSLPDWAGRLLPLVLDLSEATDSADVSAAFARAAAPIGSWKLKRQKVLWSITALVGGGIGYEEPFHQHLGSQEIKGGFAGGLIAPVGIELSFPLPKSSSIGLLVSVLDIGQITWSRLGEKNETPTDAGTKSLPDPSLSQVFSPGAYVVFGLGHSPFTLGAGGSIAPDLRQYTYELSSVSTEQSVTVWRVGLFIAVDVTLFPL